MKNSLPAKLATVTLLSLTAQTLHADIIFQASDANTSQISNTSGNLDALTVTGDTNGGTLLLNNENGNFNSAGITSSDTISTLNGGSITPTSIVTMTLTIEEITGGFRANGVTFGVTNDNTTFGAETDLRIQVRPNNAAFLLTSGFGTPDPITAWTPTESSITDGLTVTLTADVTGYTFSFSDLIPANANPIVDITLNGIPFVGQIADNRFPTFSSPQLQTQLSIDSNGINLTGFYDEEVPALTPLLTTFWFSNVPNTDNFALTGLTPGSSYLVEFGQADDRSSVINFYRQVDSFGGGAEEDPLGATNLTYGGPENPAILVTGTFTATHSVQSFRWGVFGNDESLLGSQISFLQVRKIELPSEVQVSDIRVTDSAAEIDFIGLNPASSYQLVRSVNLEDGFPLIVDSPRAPAGAADTFRDSSPLAERAFYRLDETP